ncbi:PsbP-related protein [Candidatus Formimonas warabiya]|uniref:DUF1795 domain-containing protein n=1 Tax=Formimonas warabiya TaxID=1761012 RepID=A0A3G1KSJ8_FORW1|nr:PsbP-related protein [Candidatus Formimonas warabiya]ATW25400.1 hypothetical protein DCMF_12010 [Candidatus Formimonas warabiya]
MGKRKIAWAGGDDHLGKTCGKPCMHSRSKSAQDGAEWGHPSASGENEAEPLEEEPEPGETIPQNRQRKFTKKSLALIAGIVLLTLFYLVGSVGLKLCLGLFIISFGLINIMKPLSFLGLVRRLDGVIIFYIGAALFIYSSLSFADGTMTPEFSFRANPDKGDPALTPTENQTVNFLTYQNMKYHLEIDYPGDWEVKTDIPHVLVAFVGPIAAHTRAIHESVNIVVGELPPEISLEELKEREMKGLKSTITEANILQVEDEKVDGNPGFKLICTGKQGNFQLQWLMIFTIKDDREYIITYCAEQPYFNHRLSVANKMIDSCRFQGDI